MNLTDEQVGWVQEWFKKNLPTIPVPTPERIREVSLDIVLIQEYHKQDERVTAYIVGRSFKRGSA